MPARVVLVDDHRVVRDGLRMVLLNEPGFAVVGEVGDARGAVECVRQTRPDLVIMDVHLPDESGIACAQRILAERPETKILILSADADLMQVREALRVGAQGYVSKEEAAGELVRAVQAVLKGKVHLSDAALAALVEGLKSEASSGATVPPQLSERETTVLKLTADGLRNKEIAAQLGVSPKTIETYRARLMSKLGCASTADLVRYALRKGLSPR